MNPKHAMSAVVVFFSTLLLLSVIDKAVDRPQNMPPQYVQPYYPPYYPPERPIIPELRKPQITTEIPDYLDYRETVEQLKKWNREAPDFTEVGVYGKSSKEEDLYYLKIEADRGTDEYKPVVLITSCIHGNEPLSASTVMGYIGTMLGTYGEDKDVTELIDSRIIYFIPVVSPDSYPRSRHVDGVDPNRNFPTQDNPGKRSVPPVEELKNFFLEIKPKAVISGHTWGRIYLTPWGDQNRKCEDDDDYQKIIGEMCRLSRYRMQRACEMYNRPIYGTEVDWYYRNGAFSIVMEFGTHQRIPSSSEIQEEFNRTYKAVIHFIRHAPLVRSYREYRFPAHAA